MLSRRSSSHWLSTLILLQLQILSSVTPVSSWASTPIHAQIRKLQRDLRATQCLLQHLDRLQSGVVTQASEVNFESYLQPAREVDPTATDEQVESLALSLWGQRFLEENPLLHRALSESLSARLTANTDVDWAGKVQSSSVQKELDHWIQKLSQSKSLSTEEAAGLIDFKNDVVFRLEHILSQLPSTSSVSQFAQKNRIQSGEADLRFYQKYSGEILREEREKLGDWILQSLGEAGKTPATRERFYTELKRAGTPDKKLFGRYQYLSPSEGLPTQQRLTPPKDLSRAMQLLRDQPGNFSLSQVEQTIGRGTPEQQSFWIELLLERAESREFPELSGYTLTQLLSRLSAPAPLILRASQLPMPSQLRAALEPQLLLQRMGTTHRTHREIQKSIDSYYEAVMDRKKAPDLQLIHTESLSEIVWSNPKFAEIVRLGHPEHLLFLSEAIIGALPRGPKSSLSSTQKTQLAYLVNSLLDGRKYLRDPVLREQLDQNIYLICERGDHPAPMWLK